MPMGILKVFTARPIDTEYIFAFIIISGFPTLLVIGAVITNILLNGSMSNSMREDL